MGMCKKIAVCHGKVCGVKAAKEIQDILEQAYRGQDVEITERTCCGRCECANSIVVDDAVTISNLSPKNIVEQFFADPQKAIETAKKEQEESEKKLEHFLSDDNLF